MAPSTPFAPVEIGHRQFRWGSRTYVMGIINVTPDSLTGDGLVGSIEAARDRAERMVRAGVDILDVGGESTRPGSEPVDPQEERRRTEPVVSALAPLGVPISIDTRRAVVAEAAITAGASLINDVSGLNDDPDMAPLAAETGAAVCLMHMRGTPASMQDAPEYGDVVEEVASMLVERRLWALEAGIAPERIIVDPGIGFGKTVEHNLDLLNQLDWIRERCQAPLLVGTSRKRFIGAVLDRPTEERLMGTAASVAAAIARGADIVRVHDVPEMVDVARLADAVLRRPARG